MTLVSCKIIIDVPANTVWQAISNFVNVGYYLPGVINCTVEGSGIGALRTLTSVDGSAVTERLETLDEIARQLSYALLTDTPFRNCLTSMAVRGLAASQAELEWSATFDPAGIPESEAEEIFEAALLANCIALKQFMER